MVIDFRRSFHGLLVDGRPLRGLPLRGRRREGGLASSALCALLLAGGLGACTLITDVDREKIPRPPTPTFPEVDAGPQPTPSVPDASVPDASVTPEEPVDARTDAGLDAGDAGDAGAPDADAG